MSLPSESILLWRTRKWPSMSGIPLAAVWAAPRGPVLRGSPSVPSVHPEVIAATGRCGAYEGSVLDSSCCAMRRGHRVHRTRPA